MNLKHGTRTLAALAVLSGCAGTDVEQDPVRPVRAFQVGDASIFVGRPFPGRAKAVQEVNLSFRVAGTLLWIPDVGRTFKSGQEIATLDPRDFDVELRNVTAQLSSAQATLTLAIDEAERAQSAFDQGAVTDIELARKNEASASAKAHVDALGASVEAASDALSDTKLRAPFEGRVVAKYVENFEDVQAKQAVLRLLDASRIEMIIDIPEHLISYADAVTDITCTFDAFPGQAIPAEVFEIGTEASETTRTYPVTLRMDQPEGFEILPGMTGEARGSGQKAITDDREGFEVPISAVTSTDGETSHVWVIDESSGLVSRRDIELGTLTSHGILIKGVDPGEWIATAGASFLQQGQQVRIMKDGAGS